jgi:hypothetical protein
MSRRIAGVLALAALQLVAVVLAHQLVFLVRYGSRYGEALVHSGHGTAWGDTVTSVLVLGGGLALLAVAQLARLGLVARTIGGPAAEGVLQRRALIAGWLRLGPPMAALTGLVLTIQENLERASIGAATSSAAILLSPEYPGGLWIAIVVGLAAGLLAALFVWRRRILLARIRAARARLRQGTTANPVPRPARVVPPVGSLLGRNSALRAPPFGSAV